MILENEMARSINMEKLKRLTKMLLPFVAVGIFLAALFFMYEAVRDIHYRDVIARLRSFTPSVIFLALAATALNYLVLTVYDVLALRYTGISLPYGRVAFTSFLSYVFSYNVGLSIFGSGAIRMRLYSSWGVDTGSIARIVGFCAATFWLGLATMGGLALVTFPPLIVERWRLLGLVPLGAVTAYLLAAARGGEGIRIRGFSLRLPEGRVAFAQVAVASLDWTLAALVLYVLLPAGAPSFPSFLAIYVIAQLAGASSHVPGGVGVFESILFASLSSSAPSDALVGALLAYRGIYYLIPLATAIVAFIVREAWVVRQKIKGAAEAAGRLFSPFAPVALSLVVLFSGAVLLFSGAVPAVAERLKVLDLFLPLSILELSHFSASLVGLALIVIADAVRRRIDMAYWFAIGLLGLGAVLSVLKGLDYEEAIIMLASAVLILPSRHLFVRRATILSRGANAWTIAVGGIVVVTSFWLAAFAHKHALYSGEQWWIFELSKEAPRALRAGVGVAVAAAAIGLRILLSPAPRLPQETLETSESDIRRVLALSKRATTNLALLGDKYFRFSRRRNSFLMYGLSARTFVVMGDPVGDPSEYSDLLWDFYEDVRRQGGRVMWYEVGAEVLPLLSELGFRFFKIGEEAIVDLATFSLEGGVGKRLRPPRNKMIREGYSFSLLPPEALPPRMGELEAISNAWLASKKGREKGFSLGFFDEEYLANFMCALVEKDGRIIAFSNIWRSGDGFDLSIDLMRHNEDAPNGTMEYLFIELLSWGSAQGYRSFNLGMAPLSGVEAREVAPIWNKAVSMIFHSGEGIYNFQGLRAFKEKFNPVWTPRYLAVSSGASLPIVAADIVILVSRGKRLPPHEVAKSK
jgi:phosphatidylglycerol lysyltransferase